MYYACAIEDVKRRSKGKGKRELKKQKKSRKTIRSAEIKGRTKKDRKEERSIEKDEDDIENIRRKVETLIQHDTAANFKGVGDLARELEKEDIHTEKKARHSKKEENKRGWHDSMSASKTKGSNDNDHNDQKHASVENSGRKGQSRPTKVTHGKVNVASTEKPSKENATAPKVRYISGPRMNSIVGKYHEVERLLGELKNLVELEEDRLKGDKAEGNKENEVKHHQKSKVNGTVVKKAGVFTQNIKQVHPKDAKSTIRKKGILPFERNNVNRKATDSEKRGNSKVRVEAAPNDVQDKEKREKEVEEELSNENIQADNGEIIDPRENNDEVKDEKSFFKRCKLAAYLYFIAVRGFGQKFYLKDSPSWCKNGCVKASASKNKKIHRRPRAAT